MEGIPHGIEGSTGKGVTMEGSSIEGVPLDGVYHEAGSPRRGFAMEAVYPQKPSNRLASYHDRPPKNKELKLAN